MYTQARVCKRERSCVGVQTRARTHARREQPEGACQGARHALVKSGLSSLVQVALSGKGKGKGKGAALRSETRVKR